MNKLLGDQLLKKKQEIKNRWKTGESVPSIAKSFNVSERSIYFHLGQLSPDDQALHAKNMALKRMKRKEDNVKKETAIGGESDTEASGSVLADFK